MTPREPTPEECSSRAKIGEGWACWYPQMGGYVGKCVVVPSDGTCFDAWVWHDGEFPFSANTSDCGPTRLHHCDPEQFVRFGELVASLKGASSP